MSITIIRDIKPFITSNITGKPIEVRSRRHKKELLKAYGLVEKEKMSNPRNKKRFNGSSGFEWGGE